MTRSIEEHGRTVAAPMEHCWRHVGVGGDRSCPELAELIHCRNCPALASAARVFFDRPAPAGYLESWRRILEQPETPVDVDARSALIFRLGKEWLALPTSACVEVTDLRRVHRLPHRSNTVLAGIVNIRGQLHLCVRLEAFLGLESEAEAVSSTARLLVIERTGARWAFAVSEVAGIQRVPASSLRDVPATVSGARTRATTALFAWQDHTVGLLDEARLLDGMDRRISS